MRHPAKPGKTVEPIKPLTDHRNFMVTTRKMEATTNAAKILVTAVTETWQVESHTLHLLKNLDRKDFEEPTQIFEHMLLLTCLLQALHVFAGCPLLPVT